jgi:hypothetical protein
VALLPIPVFVPFVVPLVVPVLPVVVLGADVIDVVALLFVPVLVPVLPVVEHPANTSIETKQRLIIIANFFLMILLL